MSDTTIGDIWSTPVTRERFEVVREVCEERNAQYAQWGQQDHPLTPPDRTLGLLHSRKHQRAADLWKALNAERVKSGRIAWDGILLEEVYEALAEDDPAKARAELVQVAAVAVAMIESIDRLEAAEAH